MSLSLRQHPLIQYALAMLRRFLDFLGMQSLRLYVAGTQGDMVERGMIIVAIVAVTLAIWFTIGNRIAAALNNVAGML